MNHNPPNHRPYSVPDSTTSEDRPPSESARVEREIILLSLVVWSLHFAIVVTRSLFVGHLTDMGTTAARAITSLAGALAVYAIYCVLRRRDTTSSIRLFARAVLLSAPACVLVSVVNEAAFWSLSAAYREMRIPFLEANELAFTVSVLAWIFIAWSALFAATVNAAAMRQRERRLLEAESAAHQAQLMALRLQISPHFLFNTLNTLSGLVGLDRRADAEEFILNLSSFLRYSLADSLTSFVPLEQEIEAQQMYLAIEKTRFGDRVKIDYRISPGCERGLVPSLILQPLVENAIKHAVAPSEGEVTLSLGAERKDGKLRLWVEHGPVEISGKEPTCGLGIGLENVKRRLRVLYSGDACLRTGTTDSAGWRSILAIPWVEASS
ncbi:MAG: histidine kinase [Sphingosinicella sp.]|nr:histidine kinase [Sphingosinicella sp.]